MKKISGLLLVLCFACTPGPYAPPVKVSLTDSGGSVKFSGLDNAIIGEISRDSSKGLWQALIPVFRMPADTDLKNYQPVQSGTYRLKDKTIVFTPDTPFVKGRTYFMRYYHFGGTDNMWDYVRGKSKLGRIPHTDLVF